MSLVSDIKLIRTDTTLDLSQKAEKGMNPTATPGGLYTLRMAPLSLPLVVVVVVQPFGLELLRKDLGVLPVQDHDTWQQQRASADDEVKLSWFGLKHGGYTLT
ncbi:hypothetical protein CY35_16G068500 [Sphagnum magellanicum]|nr:hypothetical protein CY35_16G068500 [Sphagnum magellanicum]